MICLITIDILFYFCQYAYLYLASPGTFNTLRPRQNGRHFPDEIFKCIFLNENAWISIKISLKFVPDDPINNIQALVQIMVWRQQGDKPLSEPMMIRLPTHICVTRPQWVKAIRAWYAVFTNSWAIYEISHATEDHQECLSTQPGVHWKSNSFDMPILYFSPTIRYTVPVYHILGKFAKNDL